MSLNIPAFNPHEPLPGGNPQPFATLLARQDGPFLAGWCTDSGQQSVRIDNDQDVGVFLRQLALGAGKPVTVAVHAVDTNAIPVFPPPCPPREVAISLSYFMGLHARVENPG